MSRVAFGSLTGGVAAAIALGLLLLIAASDDAGATAPPSGFDIFATGIDMDGSDNTATSIGAIDGQSGNVAIGDEACVDIVVDEVPNGGTTSGGTGIFGIGLNIHWDPAIAGLVGYRAGDKDQGLNAGCSGAGDTSDPDDFLYSFEAPAGDQSGDAAGAVFQSNGAPPPTDAAPNVSGDFRIDNVWTDATEFGPGRLAQFNFRCLTTGSTTITMDDNTTGGGTTMGVLFAEPAPGGTYLVSQEHEATLFCNTSPGDTDTPSPTPDVTDTPTATPVVTGPTPSPTPVNTNPTPTGSVTDTPTPTDTGTSQQELMGDTDCNGTIGVRDNQALLRHILGQAALSTTPPCPAIGDTLPNGELWGDWDCNGSIGVRDNQAALRFILNQTALSQTEPCTDIGQPVDVA